LSDAHFGLGKSLGYINNFAGSAAAFEQAALLDANQAYAYYYAGLAYNQAKRVDLMARNFETFLRLAPTAPERARVESIMRTIRK
jgi:tetratricopeptide (TPR) repeat protein